MATLHLCITGRKLPGLRYGAYSSVHIGLGRGADLSQITPGDAPEAVFNLTVNVVTDREGRLDFRGQLVQGRRGERFFYLSWGELRPDGGFELFRAAKLHLSTIPEADLDRALARGTPIEAVLDLTDRFGGPLCASVRPP
jgi:hypothetical protein